jgi:hypothetical protein
VLEACRGCQFIINWTQTVHLVGSTIMISYDAWSTKY